MTFPGPYSDKIHDILNPEIRNVYGPENEMARGLANSLQIDRLR